MISETLPQSLTSDLQQPSTRSGCGGRLRIELPRMQIENPRTDLALEAAHAMTEQRWW